MSRTSKPVSDEIEMVSIPLAEFKYLKECEDTLSRLEMAGVDNWEWYGEALRGDKE